jgi:hypothetical protein
MMIRNRIFLKTISFFFLLEILVNIAAPSVSWALTSGPTAPEATSFEPVDTTDMVDLKTGDFTYNLPILEVPGPGGGYPINLSYHAGILPNAEASWTGLGFNINPGSISRLVNGFPDDHFNVNNLDHTFWEGGEESTSSIGISVGIANIATVSANLEFSQDTYRGAGVGASAGAGLGFNYMGATAQLTYTAGITPYGNVYQSKGMNVGIGTGVAGAASLSAGGNVDLSSGEVSTSTGVSFLGASIRSSGSGFSASGNGFGVSSSVYNGKSGNISTYHDGFTIDIPVYYGVNLRLGQSYRRYWIDETEEVATFGSIYQGGVAPGYNKAFDHHDLLDLDIDIAEFSDPEKVLGGSIPDVDSYTVSGQGVFGNIKPYSFKSHLQSQDKKSNGKILTKNYRLNQNSLSSPVTFRFVGDFSNRYEYTPPNFNVSAGGIVSYEFSDNEITGRSGDDGIKNNHLIGSRHVEWFTNAAIHNSKLGEGVYSMGFINTQSTGFERPVDLQIGGFSITNETGVSYHYALPAYSYNEVITSRNISKEAKDNGEAYNKLSKPEKYAYTWFLTAVTGPDYVDRNNNGLADSGDWGYWVNFDYTKWLSNYKWRNPAEGAHRDIDGEFENVSTGLKELYYLDKIITETHVAIFEKSPRQDGKEIICKTEQVCVSQKCELTEKCGFAPIPIYTKSSNEIDCCDACEMSYCPLGNCNELAYNNCLAICDQNHADILIGYENPRSMLRLDKVKLFNYDDFIKGDFSNDAILKAVDFKYDYDLALGTPNGGPGKLALREIAFKGKNDVQLIPSHKFVYDNNPAYKNWYDNWGFYKSDFSQEYLDNTNGVLGRLTTLASSAEVDAWSLTKIITPLGATVQVDYESDQYDDVSLASHQFLRIKEVQDFQPGKFRLSFWENGLTLSDFLQPGDQIGIDLIGAYQYNMYSAQSCECDVTFSFEDPRGGGFFRPILFSDEMIVEQVDPSNSNQLIVTGTEFYNHIKYDPKVVEDYALGGEGDACPTVVKCTTTFGGGNAWPDYFPAGVISFPEKARFGGGLRVASIAIVSNTGEVRSTKYEYENGVTTIEPFEIPAPKIDPAYITQNSGSSKLDPTASKLFYKRAMYKKLYRQIGLSRQLPGPGVMYAKVRVKESHKTSDGVVHDIPNYSEYEFETFKPGMIDIFTINPVIKSIGNNIVYDDVEYDNSYLKTVALKDYTSRIGSLKRIAMYKSSTNQLISETKNHFLHDEFDGSFEDNLFGYESELEDRFSNQGLVEETFSMARVIRYKKYESKPYPIDTPPPVDPQPPTLPEPELPIFFSAQHHLMATVSKLETFPTIQTGQTVTNHLTGITTSTTNLEFDFYSGLTTKVLSRDSYGNRFLSVTVPAYERYPAMHSKALNASNRNMLTQVAETYQFAVDDDNTPIGVVSASIQTWSDQVRLLNHSTTQVGIWRMHSTYTWNGQNDLDPNTGLYPYGHFSENPFNWNSTSNSQWQKTGEATLYDTYSNALEARDLNGNYSASRMSSSKAKVVANTLNSKYEEMAYSGAEFYAGNTTEDGGVLRGGGNPSKSHIHTGEYSLLVGSSKTGFEFNIDAAECDMNKKYRASVWVYAPGTTETQDELNNIKLIYRINGKEIAKSSPKVQKSKSKSWYLLNLDINPDGANTISVSVENQTNRDVYFDDFRVHPLNSKMNSFVYDSFTGELTYIIDNNNIYTRFEYDAVGRLIRTSRESLNFDFGDGKESYKDDKKLSETIYNFGQHAN